MKTRLDLLLMILFVLGGVRAAAAEFSWQKTHAQVSSTGDMEWAPQPLRYEQGDSIRYIDYEHGDDSSDGLTRDTPWQHHPWDTQASAMPAGAREFTRTYSSVECTTGAH